MNRDFRKKIHAILDAQSKSFQALRAARGHIEAAHHSFAQVARLHAEAIDGALAANRAAMELLEQLDS